MPKMDTLAWLSWLASISGHICLALMLGFSGKFRKYPGLFGYVCVRSLASFVLASILLLGTDANSQSWWYFYIYYFGGIVGCVFSFVIIVNLTTSFVDSAEMRYVMKTALRYLGGAFLLGSGLFSFLSPLPFDEQVIRLCAAMERACSLAWVAVFLCMMFLIRWLRMAWPAESKGLAVGYALMSLGAIFHDWLLGDLPTHILSDAKMCFYLLSLTTWIYTLRSAVRPIPLPRLSAAPTLEKV